MIWLWIAEPVDATDLLGKKDLELHQNEKVLFTDMVVVAQDDGRAINYKNEAEKTDDIYYRVVLSLWRSD